MRNQSPWCSWAAQEPIPTLLVSARRPPRGVQERPLRLWKPPLRRPSFFKGSKRPPRGLQEASRAHLAAILAPCLIDFEASSMRCCPCFSHVSSLKAPSPRALDPRPKAWRNARELLRAELRPGHGALQGRRAWGQSGCAHNPGVPKFCLQRAQRHRMQTTPTKWQAMEMLHHHPTR